MLAVLIVIGISLRKLMVSLGAVLLCMGTLVRPAAAGTTYKVSTVADLQKAIDAVNLGSGGDLIVLAPGFYPIASQLTINRDVTIQGDPAALTVIDGGGLVTILNVRANNISIQNLTFQKGSPAISYEGSGVFLGTGVTITGSNTGFSPGDSGGATFFTNSTVANNTGNGIAISCAELHLTNVTVSNNDVGVYFGFPCGNRMQITNSLIVANKQDCGGGGFFLPVGDASRDSDGSCVTKGFGPGLTTTSLTALGLGGLLANGGPTMTEAIAATSSARDLGDNTACPATDQRGFLRNDLFCDIGAYEFGALPAGNTPTGLNVSVSPAPGVTVTFSNVTVAGNTTATSGGPLPPTGFKVDGLVYDISTTAMFTGSVKVCLPYSPTINPNPRIYHYEIVPPATVPGWVNKTTSIDAVNHIVCGTVSSLSPFAVLVTVPFASFTARAKIDRAHLPTIRGGDSFEVEGRGALGETSDGIAPDTEEVTLSLGALSLTIPPGSFVKKIDKDEDQDRQDRTDRDRDGDRNRGHNDDDDRTTTYRFNGVIAGVSLSAEIEQGPKHTFRFRFAGRHASFGLVVNPVTVGLAIGDDVGHVVVKADIDK